MGEDWRKYRIRLEQCHFSRPMSEGGEDTKAKVKRQNAKRGLGAEAGNRRWTRRGIRIVRLGVVKGWGAGWRAVRLSRLWDGRC